LLVVRNARECAGFGAGTAGEVGRW